MQLGIVRARVYWFFQRRLAIRTRAKRMQAFQQLMPLPRLGSVLDLGGQPEIWDTVDTPLHIRIVNLPGEANQEHASRHSFEFVEADACEFQVSENSFDCVFCNSVIEHVGGPARRKALADRIRKSGRSYWVQTPSIWFPIEAHCGMPFWWIYPAIVRKFFIDRWKRQLPDWTSMVEGTTIVTKGELEALFPDARIVPERLFGFVKSYIAFRVA